MIRLGVNIDHVATIRNARGEFHPDPYFAAKYSIKSGAHSITVHLREDRRHIKEKDLLKISKNKNIPLNLEIAASYEMCRIALKTKPNFVCLVPEKRNEVTTEGGLNLKRNFNKLKKIVFKLNKAGIRTSLFVDPTINNIELSKEIGAKCIEIHTGSISNKIKKNKKYKVEFSKIKKCVYTAHTIGLEVHAGHGMDFKTSKILSKIKYIDEFNIGHFIIGESIFFGLKNTIKKILKIIKKNEYLR